MCLREYKFDHKLDAQNMLDLEERPRRAKYNTDEDCKEFDPGTPGGECQSDGHYMCWECKHMSQEEIKKREEQYK